MEADLRRFYHCSRRGLPLVDIAWMIRHLPVEAVLSGMDGWSQTDLLLSDLMFVWAQEHHPSDPRVKRQRDQMAQRLRAGAERARQRRERLGITGSVLEPRG